MTMPTELVTVRDLNGRDVLAELVVCPNCSHKEFVIFMVGKHQHVQCTSCLETFCDGTCK